VFPPLPSLRMARCEAFAGQVFAGPRPGYLLDRAIPMPQLQPPILPVSQAASRIILHPHNTSGPLPFEGVVPCRVLLHTKA
jgi:hypothetical protein